MSKVAVRRSVTLGTFSLGGGSPSPECTTRSRRVRSGLLRFLHGSPLDRGASTPPFSPMGVRVSFSVRWWSSLGDMTVAGPLTGARRSVIRSLARRDMTADVRDPVADALEELSDVLVPHLRA